MSLIYFLNNFNNYYNRVIKRFNSIQDYIDNSQDYSLRGTNNVLNYNKGPVNFNINDGITSDITYNYDPNQSWQPDYILVVDDTDGMTITSRWFVIEALRTRKGQYRLNLRRDVVADNYNAIITAPTFIEKATLPIDSNFIYNPENMTYNQIKSTDEILLKDETNTPWIVGYVAAGQSGEADTNITSKFSHDVDIYTTQSHTQYLNEIPHGNIINKSNIYYSVTVEGESLGTLYNLTYKLNMNNNVLTSYAGTGNQYYREKDKTSTTKSNIRTKAIASDLSNLIVSNLSTLYTGTRWINETQEGNIWDLNNKLISCSDGLYIIRARKSKVVNCSINTTESSIVSAINSVLTAFNRGSGTTAPEYKISYNDIERIELYSEKVEGSYLTSKTTITKDRKNLNDAPYCMFCIPYNSITYTDPEGTQRNTDSIINIAMARSIAEKLTQQKCYDLQLLPYCPRRDLIVNNMINFTKPAAITLGYDYNWITDSSGSNRLGFILWCSQSEGTFNILNSITVPTSNIEFKVENETTFYRLCSPNNAANFEFKATMNNGVKYFNVDFCYKPYQPYIHINPNFGRLYGADTNDTRGLICAGDFCLPQTSDAYSSYVLNNKNYQESFNRQIDNMDVMHKYQMVESGLNAISSAAGTGISAGAVTGLAGGVVAGALSLGAGIGDQFINQAKYNETIDYTKDQFNYQLGNVKARPDTLSKVSAYNPNNKIFPFVEKYTCTDEEKDALREKLKYNGMSVGVIGKITDYLQEDYSYIKGKIIRIENTSDDFHNVAAIAEELNKGVFIK